MRKFFRLFALYQDLKKGLIGKGRLKTERIGFRRPLNQVGLELVIDFEHDVARLAVNIVNAHCANTVVFIVAAVAQIAADQTEVEIFGRCVMNIGIPKQVAALAYIPQTVGFALYGHAAADGPFTVGKGEAVAGVQAEHMFGRMFAEVCADGVTRPFTFFIFAHIESVVCRYFPIFGEVAGEFGFKAAALNFANGLICPFAHSVAFI